MRFEMTELTPGERALQAEVREFLAAVLPPGLFTPGLGMDSGRDPEFSRKLGARGLARDGQFGKAVASFQAVQGHLVNVAQCAVRLLMAADLATRALARATPGIEIAAAKLIADEMSVLGTRVAHQAHGAMGVTREYPLHQLSRRLWAWRHEYGSAGVWRRRLGTQVFDAGADQLFPLIAG